QAAAGGRCVMSECGHDEVPVWGKGLEQGVQVSPAIFRVGQKMKHRPVMPKVVGAERSTLSDIAFNPSDLPGAITQPGLRSCQRDPRNIQHGHLLEPQVQQMIDQCGISSPYIDKTGGWI